MIRNYLISCFSLFLSNIYNVLNYYHIIGCYYTSIVDVNINAAKL